MEHTISSELSRLVERERLQKRLKFLRGAIEDATYELYQGGLSYGESETLAQEITVVRAEIGEVEHALLGRTEAT